MEEKIYASLDICRKLSLWQDFIDADALFAFYPLEKEVNILPLLKEYSLKKTLCLPRISEVQMDFLSVKPWDTSTLPRNKWNIPEPPHHFPRVTPEDFKSPLMIVPGVAFTPEGGRLGRGGGFYDRYLSYHKIRTVGVAFPCQIQNSLPLEAHDFFLDHIIY